ncbi:MAG: BREX-1 system adenine-specific DNA-methyltransferase PglX [Proteobacteria bacterium]|nr:BREX-1 system adenine-specific DNA-methyltransferase PglX [Pseudomonadota bacterium]
MNQTVLKNFAILAHRELVERITANAHDLDMIEPETAAYPTRHGSQLTLTEKRQHQAWKKHVQAVGIQQAIEDAAYIWFKRLCILRFMEVNQYLPNHIRVFTDETGQFYPQILLDSINLDHISHDIDIQRIHELKESHQTEALYQYLLCHQCHVLKTLLPGIFTDLEIYADLLCPGPLMAAQSLLHHLVSDIPESYFDVQSEHGQVEIIGWLYQYYLSEKHEEIVDPLYGKSISREDIPAATQLFTPDWVVQYIVDNTLGRYWMEHHPKSQLKQHLTFYVEPQTQDIISKDITPQDVTVFDPCVGSGHFLVYAIDVLIKVYRECGYSDQDAIAEIIKHNIYGLDIDDRVVQLAYFSVMMKGCQYDRQFLQYAIQPNIYAVQDSAFMDDDFIHHIANSDKILYEQLSLVAELMQNAKELGSMIVLPELQMERIQNCLKSLPSHSDFLHADNIKKLHHIIETIQLLKTRYAIVITNPPYLNKYDKTLKSYIQKHYKDYSGDLFSIFIYRCLQFCISKGYSGLLTPNVWMFIKSYKKLRQYITQQHSITTLVQMAKGAFFSIATVDVCAFVIQSQKPNQKGIYFRLEDFTGNLNLQREKLLEAIQNRESSYRYEASQELFHALPGNPIGYWAGNAILKAFQTGCPLETHASPRQGLATTNNNQYLRLWHEVQYDHIGFDMDRETAISSPIKWFPYNKGGEFRKWYGNQYYIVNYQYNGKSIKHDVLTKYPYLKTPDFVVKNPETYFNPCLSWSKISSGSIAFRYFPQGFLYDVSGCSIFFKKDTDLYDYAGFLNSIVCSKLLEIISPTLNYETGHIAILPILSQQDDERIQQLVQENIQISKTDWDTSETSWHFKKHPLI